MKPVDKGQSLGRLQNYTDAKPHLIFRLGSQCSYCEQFGYPQALHVEHIYPQDPHSELENEWDTDQDKLVYVNNVIKGKLLESETLRQQATNNTKEQFANSPDLKTELLNAIMGALDAHTLMSTQALNSETVQRGLKDILLNNAGLWETLRAKVAS